MCVGVCGNIANLYRVPGSAYSTPLKLLSARLPAAGRAFGDDCPGTALICGNERLTQRLLVARFRHCQVTGVLNPDQPTRSADSAAALRSASHAILFCFLSQSTQLFGGCLRRSNI